MPFRLLIPLALALAIAKAHSTTGPTFAKDIPLDNQRPADRVFSAHVEKKLAEIRIAQPRASKSVVTVQD